MSLTLTRQASGSDVRMIEGTAKVPVAGSGGPDPVGGETAAKPTAEPPGSAFSFRWVALR